ncbi:hypothetical protein BDZ94DRAFT_1272939 [Collybia nuda]|uniref:ATP-dependent DNA ligase family profile domain-containing protein n=1 Tax=Collybia nuda TaxID=64659 RepID=A0A9P6C9P1_9AGAR|nr:hypothetical protein BDZ94DRAFT_1272939 [Collybia nuda]
MQEITLARYLAECIGVDSKIFQKCFLPGASGSLGDEVKLALQRSSPETGNYISSLSISQVDALLDELASSSGFSHSSIRDAYPKHVRRERLPLLKTLFRPISPVEAPFLTQIILKDLRPVLYPLQVQHYSPALLNFNTASVQLLTKEHAMKVWDPSCWMLNAYRVKSTFGEAAASFELPPHQRSANIACVGTPVQIPKSEKGRNCAHALGFFQGSKKAWAEIKYDGERAQIHVKILSDRTSKITIYSKSRRDSTLDRHSIHEIIRSALGLSGSPLSSRAKVKSDIILDAEMVACDGENVAEFWRIRNLIENSAYGVRRQQGQYQESLHVSDIQLPVATETSTKYSLALVFFDILLLDGICLLSSPYSRRRALLESTIILSPGRSMIARRIPIVFRGAHNDEHARQALEKAFVAVTVDHQEGLVIKAEESRYHDHKMPWVKLKKDYIPGYGDAVDLVVVGATWDKVRGRELRVPPSTLTTLYIGALSNSEDVERDPDCQPHFQVFFTVSYGLSRSQLEEINFLIKNSNPVPYRKSVPIDSLSYSFTLLCSLQPPNWLLKTPLLAELFGAGFTKAYRSENYELRFPRLTKIHRPAERGWREAVTLVELQKIAHNSEGLGLPDEDIKDWSSNLWGRDVPPDVVSTLKRKAVSDLWEENPIPCLGSKRSKLLHNAPLQAIPNEPQVSSCMVCMDPLTTNPKNNNTFINTSYTPKLNPHKTVSRISCPTPQSIASTALHTDSPRLHLNSNLPCYPPKIQGGQTQNNTCHVSNCSPGGLFPRNALIWVMKPQKSDRACYNAYRSWIHALTQRQKIHSVDSLLAGCGWSKGTPGSSWVEHGIIILDSCTEQGKKWQEYVLEVVEQQRRNLLVANEQTRKPIWMIDSKTMLLSADDPYKIALCLLGGVD